MEDLGILIDEKLNVNWQCVLAAWEANSTLGCIKRQVTSRAKEVIVALYFDLVKPRKWMHEYCVVTVWTGASWPLLCSLVLFRAKKKGTTQLR